MRTRVVVLSVIALVAASCQTVLESLVLRPSERIRHTPAEFGYEFTPVTLPGNPEEQISIWHVHSTAPRKGILVIVPGNDSNKGRYTTGLSMFVDNG